MTKLPQDTDFAVLGGGMAGLQVAVSLSRSLKGSGQNVTVVEPREAYKDDRTFCFWNVSETPSTPAIAHRWSKWRVQANGRSHTASSDRYEYVCIPGEAFYQHAIKELDASEEVTLVTSTTAHRVQASTDNQTLRVITNHGDLNSRVVYDTRPSGLLIERSEVLQHFQGWHLKSDSAVFDAETVTLMDFDVPQEQGLHFMYVLPFSANEALVESTYFSPKVHDSDLYESHIKNYIKDRFGLEDNYTVIRKEGGVVPMTTKTLPNTGHSSWFRLGTPGGQVRPATGYSFLQVAEWIRNHKNWLSKPVAGMPRLRPPFLNWLDAVLLSFLYHRPEDAPEVFAGLFRRVSPDALIRFLSGTGNLSDTLSVMWAMPVYPFVKEAMRLGRIAPLQIRESASGST